MSWNVNDEEFHAVVALPAPERYAYFIKRAAGERLVRREDFIWPISTATWSP